MISSSSWATIVHSNWGWQAKIQSGTTLGWNGEALFGVVGILSAHPSDIGFDGGSKQAGAPGSTPFRVELGPDMHGTTGDVRGFTQITAGASILLDYKTLLRVETVPGPADVEQPVSTLGFVTDPVVVGPSITPFSGSFSMDVFLETDSSFIGIPGEAATDFSTISSEARVVPGDFPDPDDFSQPIPGAIDLYIIDVQDTSGGLLVDLSLGASNSDFSLNFFTDPLIPNIFDPQLVISRITGAFSGTFGNREVLDTTYLFSVDVTLADEDMVYSFGPSNGGLAPDVEPIPEPSTYLLFSVGIISFIVYGYRRRKKITQE